MNTSPFSSILEHLIHDAFHTAEYTSHAEADVRQVTKNCTRRQYRTIFIACVTMKVVQLFIVRQKLSNIEHVQFFSYVITKTLRCDWSDTCCL